MSAKDTELKALKKQLSSKEKELAIQKKTNKILVESKLLQEAEHIELRRSKLYNPKISRSYFFEDKKFIPHRFAQYFIEEFPDGVVCIKNDKGGENIWVYNNEKGIYENDGIPLVEQILQTILGEEIKHSYYPQVIKEIQVLTYTDQHQFVQPPEILVLKNECLNIFTGELTSFSPKNNAISRIPVSYNPDAQCPKIIKFLKQVVPNDLSYLQEWGGYHLLKDHRYQRITLLLGEGDNGKSTYLNIMRTFLGNENVASLSLYQLTTNRFASSSLYGKHANICGDIGPDELKHTGLLKNLTGGDWITAEQKNRDSFSFKNHAKFTFSCNQIPRSPDRTQAFYKRFNVVKFEKSIPSEKQDPQLLEKLTTNEELSGLLNWYLQGLRRLLQKGRFSEIESTLEKQKLYEELADPVSGFVTNCLLEDTEAFEEKQVLFKAFCDYCKGKGIIPVSAIKFRNRLQQLVIVREQQIRLGTRRPRVWMGVKLKDVTVGTVGTRSITQLENFGKKKPSNKDCDNRDTRDAKKDDEL